MKIENFSNELPDIKICSGINFSDERGTLKKSIHGDKISSLMPEIKEVLCTTTKINVIRGLHYQKTPFEIKKFITCVQGEILDVFVDIRKDSPTYGTYGVKKLNQEDSLSILIPEGFAHGYSTLSENSVVVYLQSGNFNSKFDRSINPLSLDIDWQIKNPKISEKDLFAVKFEEM